MNLEPTELSVEKPVRAWNKPLRIDFREFFSGLTRYALHGLSGQWVEAGEDLIDIASTVGLKARPEELAWLLIRRALARAMLKLARETLAIYGKKPDTQHRLIADLDLSLEDTIVRIDATFFRQPANHSILKLIKAPFVQWLEGFGLNKAQAEAVCNRLRSNFTFALEVEWITCSEQYEPIRQAFPKSPFSAASRREREWRRNAAYLRRQVDQPIFDEVFGLSQVYVPLRAYYTGKTTLPGDLPSSNGAGASRSIRSGSKRNLYLKQPSFLRMEEKIVVDVAHYLRAWINEENKEDAVRIICGGPGSGKTSALKMFAADLANREDLRVLFIPLYHIEFGRDLTTAVHNYIHDTRILSYDPLDRDEGESRLTIFFDGLDELVMQGRVGQDAAVEFVDQVVRAVERQNQVELRLQVVLGGRDMVVEVAGKPLREEQVLHLLPYHVPELGEFVDKDKLLENEKYHAKAWWRKYGRATGANYEKAPDILGRTELQEVGAQPLLNYLMALSLGRGELKIGMRTNLNEFYKDLVEAVYYRRWGARKHPNIARLDLSDFEDILERIALAAWHTGSRGVLAKQVAQLCKDAGLLDKLEAFEKGAEEGAISLLATFFFGRASTPEFNAHRSFEFTHKTFGEYLAARRIVRTIGLINSEVDRRRKDRESGWDERDALGKWVEVCGPRAMDLDLLGFVRREVALRIERVGAWQQTICELLGYALSHGMPMERVANAATYVDMSRGARNAEEALLAALYACASTTRQKSSVRWPTRTALGELIKRLQGQRESRANVVALHCLGFLDCSGQQLWLADLWGANLRETDLRNADFWGARLWEADLRGADVENANFTRADLKWADLRRVKIWAASLEGADMADPNLWHQDRCEEHDA